MKNNDWDGYFINKNKKMKNNTVNSTTKFIKHTKDVVIKESLPVILCIKSDEPIFKTEILFTSDRFFKTFVAIKFSKIIFFVLTYQI